MHNVCVGTESSTLGRPESLSGLGSISTQSEETVVQILKVIDRRILSLRH